MHGEVHRDGDQPAIIQPNGTQWWYQNGIHHRDGDKPAVIFAGGSRGWYQNGKKHRDDDQPAVIYSDGTRIWYLNGKIDRVNHYIVYDDGVITFTKEDIPFIKQLLKYKTIIH